MAQKKAKNLKIYNIHAGHNPDGRVACGAVGLIKESTEARQVSDKVITMLKILGKTVYDCTVDDGISQNDVLEKIVKKCNSHDADIDISIHFNAGRRDQDGDGSTGGVEVYVLPNSTLHDIAEEVCKQIASNLDIRNRGVKESSSLYVLRKTNASAMLIEVCFVDDKDDVDKYSSAKAAEAIIYGITGRKYTYGSMQSTVSTIKYYPKYAGKTNSIVDALAAVGEKDTSLTHREQIAANNSIQNYTGSAAQNLKMMQLLMAGKLKNM